MINFKTEYIYIYLNQWSEYLGTLNKTVGEYSGLYMPLTLYKFTADMFYVYTRLQKDQCY